MKVTTPLKTFFYLVILTCVSPSLRGQSTTWTDAGGDNSWSNDSNWTNNAPTSATNVIFADPISVVGVDTGGAATVASITVDSGTSAFQLVPSIAESLVVNGSFINNSVNTVDVSIDYTVGSISTLDGPIVFNNSFSANLRTATIAGSITLNSSIVLQINNSSGTGYGRLVVGAGANLIFGGAANSVSFSVASTYTGINGEVFNLVSNSGGSLTGFGASLFNVATLPTLSGGLTWNTSALNVGTLSVVPEPKTWLMLALGLTVIVVLRRRQKA